jgi:PAS domain S-box-containing protein
MQDDFFKSILVVDDDHTNSEVIQNFLVKKGYGCQIASDADQVMRRLGQQYFDLVIFDIVMGKKDGIILMKEVRELYPHLEFIIMTGHGDMYSYSDIIAAGAMDYLTKPFSLKDLHARLERIRWQKWTERELKKYQDHLEELVKERTAQLELEINERLRTEAALKAAERKYRSIFESSPMGIFQSTPAGNYITSNKAFANILGYDSPEDLTNSITNIAEQVYAKPHDRQECIRSLSQTDAETFELEVKRKDGSTALVSNHVRVVRDDDGRILCYEGVVEDITERRKVQKLLEQSRREWEQIFHAIGHPTVILDREHNILNANQAILLATGKSNEEIVGKKCHEVFHRLDQPSPGCPLEKLLLTESFETVEMEQEALGGVFLVSCTPLLDDEGHIRKIIHIATEITERKRAEEALRKSEARFRKFAEEASFEGIFFHQRGQILDVNETFARMSRYEREELIGTNVMELVAPESRSVVQMGLNAEKEADCEIVALRKDGSTVPVEIRAKAISYRGKMVRVAAVRDITERKKAEEALRAANQQLLNIIEFLPDPTFVVDSQGAVVAWNQAMEEIAGVLKKDILGKGNHAFAVPFYGRPRPMMVDLVIGNDVQMQGLYERLERKGNTLYAELYVPGIYGGKGGTIWATASPLCDRHGNVIGAIESIRDITERKKMESALLQREKELEARSLELEEMNTALKVLLKRREEDQREFGVHVLSNLKELVFPYVEKLRDSRLNEIQSTYLGILESHLKEISSPFLRRLSSEFTNLSPMELQIATLIKEGRQNKEMAKMLGVSVNTILTHRYHLRTKLGVKNKDINLRSYLKSIDS